MIELLNSFKRYLVNTLPEIVIKDKSEADKYETIETRRLGDLYCSISLEMDSLITYENLHEISLKRAGISDPNEIKAYLKDKNSIPSKYIDVILKSERKIFLSEFEEMNTYYRMLMGLPPVGEDYIFLNYEDMERYGFVETADPDDFELRTPIHRLPRNVLEAMDVNGFLKEIQKLFPESKYVSYLGKRRIDLAIARMAGHFAIIYVPKIDNVNRFYRDFSFHYDEAREYFLSTVYNFSYSSRYENYDGMIGFMILHMAIHRMISTTFKVMVDRDFYDLETCRIFLESYKIPFEKLFTINQQKMIIKNLNLLLMNKHTPRVLYDVLDLLGYDNIEITKYLLVKQHKLFQETVESDLRPSFSYKLMVDDNKNQYIELDKSKMFDYYFVGVDMLSNDTHLENITAANTYEYDEFTSNDSLWIHDDELVDKLEKAEINYVETKYANISLTFRMQEKTFELVYMGRLILDKKPETSLIMIDIPLIVDTPQSLFDIQVLLICLMCKKNHMEPSLLTSPSKILYILGFNFKADLEKIKEDIRNNPRIYDQEIAKYLENIIFITPDDVNRMYTNIRKLEVFLANAMQETSSVETYFAYKKLYDTVLYSKLNNEMYQLKNGEIPETFTEYLQDKNVLLYEFVEKVEEDQITDYIDYIATKFSTLFPDTEYMSYLAPVDMYLIDAILKMLRAFKSYTIDIRGVDVIYRFDSRYHNLLKFLAEMEFKVRLKIIEPGMRYSDWVNEFKETMEYKEIRNKLYELASMSVNLSDDDFLRMADHLVLKARLNCIDFLQLHYGDSLKDYHGTVKPKENIHFEDRSHLVSSVHANDRLKLSDKRLRFVVDGVEYTPNNIRG